MSRKSKSIYGAAMKRDRPKKRPGRHKKIEINMKKGWEDIPRELELKND